MAVAYDTDLAPVTVTFLAAGETENVVFDAGSNANRTLLVCVTWRDQDNVISGVTYAGQALTSLGAKVELNDFSMQLWARGDPASGSNTIAITMGAGLSNSPGQVSAWVGSATDAAGTPVDGYVSASGSGSTANIQSSPGAITSAVGDMIVTFHATFNVTDNLTATAGSYTERQDAATGGGISTEFGDAVGAASVTPTATWSNGAFAVTWIAMGVNVNASGGGGETITVDKWLNYVPTAHKRVYGVVTSGLNPPNRFGS